MGKEALVVPRNLLFENNEFQGFLPLEQRNLISCILKNYNYHARGEELEKNFSLKQVIPYVWIVNPANKQVFLYKRAVNKSQQGYVETRYANKYSGGVGGHIDRDTEEKAENPILHAMMRELKEEVEMVKYPNPVIVGYLNDDADELGKVHFGIVAIAETTENVKSRKSEGLDSGAFYSVDEAERIFFNPENKVENWTSLSWPFVKSYLLSVR